MFIGWALWWYIPRRRLYSCTAGSGPSRVQRTAACGGLPLTACPGCATSSGAAGAYILQSRPLSLDRERAGGDRVDRGEDVWKIRNRKAACIKGLWIRNMGGRYKVLYLLFFAECFQHSKRGAAKIECENKRLFPLFYAMI